MALNAKRVAVQATGNKQEPMEAGTYPCRVVQIIDLGVQPQRAFDGNAKPPIQHIRITYEFTDEFCLDDGGKEQDDKPRWLSEDIPFHSLSADLAKSTKRYKAIDPQDNFDGDFTQLVGCACNVTIVNSEGKGKNVGKVYNNIGAVTSMRDRDAKKCAELVNEPTVFLMDEPDKKAWGKLPQWLQDKIKAAIDFEQSPLAKVLAGGEPDKQEPKPEPKQEPVADDGEEDSDKPW